MKKTNRVKHWRLNVLVYYYCGQESAACYRPHILELLKHLASIYKLDYAISEACQFAFDPDLSGQTFDTNTYDLIHFRSNENTRVERKDFRATIDCIFHKVPSLSFEGVDVGVQFYKALPEYPFPDRFYRPLNYPYIEFQEDSHIRLLVYTDHFLKVIEKEQDYPLN